MKEFNKASTPQQEGLPQISRYDVMVLPLKERGAGVWTLTLNDYNEAIDKYLQNSVQFYEERNIATAPTMMTVANVDFASAPLQLKYY